MKESKQGTFCAKTLGSPRMRRLSVMKLIALAVTLPMLIVAMLKINHYVDLFLTFEEAFFDYGDEGVMDEYPEPSARMRLADIPPPRTGQRKEPSLREAFPLLKWPPSTPEGASAVREDISKPIESIRLRNTTQAEVDYYVTRGYVVVVEDMAKDMAHDEGLWGWPCERYAKTWPNGLMQGTYPTPWRENDPEEKYTVRLRATDVWMDTFRPAWYRKFTLPGCYWDKKCSDYIDAAADAASYAWFVKDREPQELKEDVQRHWRPPYYMDSEYARNMALDTFEMWFSMRKYKSGAYAHSDPYCETAASMQLKGSKTWRFMNPGPRVDTYKDRFRQGDAQIYAERRETQEEWTPELLVHVPEGAGIIFPPYAYHETHTQNDECSVSTTFYHVAPIATRYLRYFMPRILNQHLGYMEACHRFWDKYALWTMHSGSGVPDASGKIMPEPTEEYLEKDSMWWGESKVYLTLPTTDEKLMKIRFEKILKDVDLDGNDIIDEKEIVHFIRTSFAYLKQDDGWIRTTCREYLAYYDLDDDKKITRDELWDGWEHWNINNAYAVLTHMGGLWHTGAERWEW